MLSHPKTDLTGEGPRGSPLPRDQNLRGVYGVNDNAPAIFVQVPPWYLEMTPKAGGGQAPAGGN